MTNDDYEAGEVIATFLAPVVIGGKGSLKITVTHVVRKEDKGKVFQVVLIEPHGRPSQNDAERDSASYRIQKRNKVLDAKFHRYYQEHIPSRYNDVDNYMIFKSIADNIHEDESPKVHADDRKVKESMEKMFKSIRKIRALGREKIMINGRQISNPLILINTEIPDNVLKELELEMSSCSLEKLDKENYFVSKSGFFAVSKYYNQMIDDDKKSFAPKFRDLEKEIISHLKEVNIATKEQMDSITLQRDEITKWEKELKSKHEDCPDDVFELAKDFAEIAMDRIINEHDAEVRNRYDLGRKNYKRRGRKRDR